MLYVQKLNWQQWNLHGSAPGPLYRCCSCLVWCFGRLLTMGVWVFLTLLPALRTFSLLLSCLIWPWYKDIWLILLHLTMLNVVDITERPTHFWKKRDVVALRKSGGGRDWVKEREERLWFECIMWEKNN